MGESGAIASMGDLGGGGSSDGFKAGRGARREVVGTEVVGTALVGRGGIGGVAVTAGAETGGLGSEGIGCGGNGSEGIGARGGRESIEGFGSGLLARLAPRAGNMGFAECGAGDREAIRGGEVSGCDAAFDMRFDRGGELPSSALRVSVSVAGTDFLAVMFGEGAEGRRAMKLFGPLPDILSSLCRGKVCVRLGESGRWPSEPPVGRGGGGCIGRGPRARSASDGFRVPFAVDGLEFCSTLLRLLVLPKDGAREWPLSAGLACGWLYGSACFRTYSVSNRESGGGASWTGVALR